MRGNPKVSFLLETHNMSVETIRILSGLREYPSGEIIVIDDGSMHRHTMALFHAIRGPNEFLLHFNDLFVVLTMNRAIGFARGELVVKMQDDDLYPGVVWINEAIDLFEKHKDMMILGGRGSLNLPPTWKMETYPLPWEPYCQEFQFVQAINEAPMWIRRTDFIEMGGADEDFAPHYWGEQELCIRAWLAGKSVGWYKSGIKRCAIKTDWRRKNKRALHGQSWDKNAQIFKEKHWPKLALVNSLVEQRNARLHEANSVPGQ